MRKITLFISLLFFLFSCEKEMDTTVVNEKLDSGNDQRIENAIGFVNETFVENSSKTKNTRSILSLQNIDTIYQIKNADDETVLKLICFKPKGYVLLHTLEDVSTPAVLFYSDNKLNKSNFNPVLTNVIDQFAVKYDEFHEVSNLKSNLKSGLSGTDPISFEDVIEEQVNSLLVNFRWHQWSPYNEFLSNSSQTGNPAGCVPIALGQIIAYNKHYVGWTFDWTKMESESVAALDEYFELNYLLNQIFINVVKKTGPNATSATLSEARKFMTNIGYNTEIVSVFDYEKAKVELKDNRPIYVQGVDKLGDGIKGHAFVCDGYKIIGTYVINNGVKPVNPAFSTNYVHINWGWKEDTFIEGFDGWSFAEGLNVTTTNGIHFYNDQNTMLLLKF
ncbi:C10 family peptidase [Labilibaculum euxinus]